MIFCASSGCRSRRPLHCDGRRRHRRPSGRWSRGLRRGRQRRPPLRRGVRRLRGRRGGGGGALLSATQGASTLWRGEETEEEVQVSHREVDKIMQLILSPFSPIKHWHFASEGSFPTWSGTSCETLIFWFSPWAAPSPWSACSTSTTSCPSWLHPPPPPPRLAFWPSSAPWTCSQGSSPPGWGTGR